MVKKFHCCLGKCRKKNSGYMKYVEDLKYRDKNND